MSSKKISLIQAFLLLLITTAVTNQTLVIPLVLGVAKRDAWISVLLSATPGFILIFVMKVLMNSTSNESIVSWVRTHFGSFAGWIIKLAFLAYLFGTSLVTLKDTTNWVDATFLPETPRVLIAATLTLLCFFAANAGFWSITICAGILLPFFIILEIFLLVTNLQYKNYLYVLPLMEKGLGPVIHGAVFSTHGVLEIIILLLIRQHLQQKVKTSFLLVYVIVSIGLILGTMLDIITNFSPNEVAVQRYPTFEQWGLVSLGKNISHLDFLSIYEWLSGSFIRISLCMYLIPEVLQLRSRKSHRITLISMTIIMLIVPIFPISDPTFVNFLRDWYYPVTLALIAGVMLLLILFAAIYRLRGRGRENHAANPNTTH
ncbi:endospore germination permease [Paenibacillus oryzisoli]|uniref:GerAB/ArcD/ProY family transporter n=1 Tax=Paenibacillus oryzisoli TaxID=1850517 RepID=UPI003D2CFAA0